MGRWMYVSALCAVSLFGALSGCGSDSEDSSGSGGSTGGSGGTGGGSGGASGGSGGTDASTGGSGGATGGSGGAGDSSVGGASGASGSGPTDAAKDGPCGPLSGGGSACDTCQDDNCCSELTACGADADCTTILQCLQGGESVPTCTALVPGGSTVFTAFAACVQQNCANRCL
jgi:hypothetical protein